MPTFKPKEPIPDTDKETVGIIEWMLTIPFMMIPVLNIIFAGLFIYFDKTSQTKRNFCAAVVFLEIIVALILMWF